jgi:hypothetical protein
LRAVKEDLPSHSKQYRLLVKIKEKLENANKNFCVGLIFVGLRQTNIFLRMAPSAESICKREGISCAFLTINMIL